MNETNLAQAKQYALQRLETELPPHLHYHGIWHTKEEVVPAVERLADMEGIQGQDRLLLLTGAWFHDLGFVEQATHHELIGARIAIQVLPGFGFTNVEVEIVRWIILATALPQSPNTLSEKIMADADLDVLGREDFLPRNEALRSELAEGNKVFSDLDWFTSQIKFLESHSYFTASSHKLRDEQKRKNLAALRETLEALNR